MAVYGRHRCIINKCPIRLLDDTVQEAIDKLDWITEPERDEITTHIAAIKKIVLKARERQKGN